MGSYADLVKMGAIAKNSNVNSRVQEASNSRITKSALNKSFYWQ